MWVIYVLMSILLIGIGSWTLEYIFTEPTTPPEPTTCYGFDRLVYNVRLFDPDAAEWLEHGDKRGLTWFEKCDNLVCCFPWDESPQGQEFWCAMSVQIRGM